VPATVAFLKRVMGFAAVEAGGRPALRFGQQMINLHGKGREMEPHAIKPAPIEQWLEHLPIGGWGGDRGRAGWVRWGRCSRCMCAIRMATLIELARYDERAAG
jgi:hypothetical protein